MQGVEDMQGPEGSLPQTVKLIIYPCGSSGSQKVGFSKAFHYLSAGLIILNCVMCVIYMLGLLTNTLTN